MGVIAVDVYATREFILKVDKEDANPVVFQIGMLDPFLRAEVNDKLSGYSVNKNGSEALADVHIHAHTRNITVVRYGLKGWKNFKDAQGNDVKFDTISEAIPKVGNRPIVSVECIKRLKANWVNELAEAIMDDNVLVEQDEKN